MYIDRHDDARTIRTFWLAINNNRYTQSLIPFHHCLDFVPLKPPHRSAQRIEICPSAELDESRRLHLLVSKKEEVLQKKRPDWFDGGYLPVLAEPWVDFVPLLFFQMGMILCERRETPSAFGDHQDAVR